MQTRSHQQMMLENILNTGKCVIIRKYFFEILGLPLFSKIYPFENYYVYGMLAHNSMYYSICNFLLVPYIILKGIVKIMYYLT